MIPDKDKNKVIDFLINQLDSNDLDFPFYEIEKKYRISENNVINEILYDLSSQQIIKESGNTFQSGRLLSKGLGIKRNGGWLKHLEFHEKINEKNKLRDEFEIESLKYSIKFTKIQIRWFYVSLFVGFVGGLSGLIALILQLSQQNSNDHLTPSPTEKVELKVNSDTLTIIKLKGDTTHKISH